MGLKELPCIIKENLTEDETKIYLIDTNLCTRENISPMERVFSSGQSLVRDHTEDKAMILPPLIITSLHIK